MSAFDLNFPNFTKLYLFKNNTDLGSIYQIIDWLLLTHIRATLHLSKKGITEFQEILNRTKATDLSPKDAQILMTIKPIYQ